MVLKGKTNVFVDSNHIYNINALIKISEHLPIEQFDLSSISLDDTKFIIWKLDNVRDIVTHYKRIRTSDLSKPILIRSDGIVIDGHHRIIKGIADGIEYLPSKILTRNQMKRCINK